MQIRGSVIAMGDVIAVFRIMPDSPESFESIKAILSKLKPDRLEEEPIAFGLKALKFTKIVPDEEGTLSKLEDSLNNVKNVQSVETVMVSRSL
jgi:elongation factor 1-beta